MALTALSFRTPPPTPGLAAGQRPSFSVIIAAYEAGATIGRAVESALTQTYPPTEVIVCDDGSKEDLQRALGEYRDRIVLLRQEHLGAAAARNTALAAASGDFVAILDADDTYCPERLEAMAELGRQRPDLDLITTDAFLVVNGKRVGRFYGTAAFDVHDQRAEILRWCFVGGWPAVRRASLIEVGGFDPAISLAFDWDCWMRLIFNGSRVGLVEAPLMEYTLHAGALTAERVVSLDDRVTVLLKNAQRLHVRDRERRILERSLRMHRGRALIARTVLEAEGHGSKEVRRSLALLLREGALPLRLRARVAAGYLQPSQVGKWLPEASPHMARLGDRP